MSSRGSRAGAAGPSGAGMSVGAAAADRRDPVAGPGGDGVAGCRGQVWPRCCLGSTANFPRNMGVTVVKASGCHAVRVMSAQSFLCQLACASGAVTGWSSRMICRKTAAAKLAEAAGQHRVQLPDRPGALRRPAQPGRLVPLCRRHRVIDVVTASVSRGQGDPCLSRGGQPGRSRPDPRGRRSMTGTCEPEAALRPTAVKVSSC